MKQLLVIIAFVSMTGCFSKEPIKSGKEGKTMLDFNMLLIDSITWMHSKDIPKGKASVLFYFSPFCPHCKSQVKEIVDDIGKLRNIQFYFVSRYPLSTIREFSKEYGLSKYPNIVAGIDTAGALSEYFEIPGVPYMAIYSGKKTLNKTYIGKIFSSQIVKAAEE